MNRMRYVYLAVAMGALALIPSCMKDRFVEEETFISRNPEGEEAGSSNPYWDWADKYPGVVSSRIERVRDVEVVVEGGYAPFAFAPSTPVLQSTGLYVASGEYVTVDVPAGAEGLNWQVGIGYRLLDGQYRKRFTDVTAKGTLEPGENRISSYFGGYLYFFYEPESVPSGNVTVTVSGVVPSDDYYLGETIQSSWLPVMKERADLLMAPSENPDSMAFLHWTEMHSKHMILTAGVSEMVSLQHPDKLLEAYDELIETAYSWAGLDIESQPKLRLGTDIQVPDAGQTTLSSGAKIDYFGSYPITFLRGDTDNTFVSEKKLMNLKYALGQTDTDDGSNFPKLIFAFADAFSTDWMRSSYLASSVERMFQMYYTYMTQGVAPGNISANFMDVTDRLRDGYERWRNNSAYGVAFLKNDDILTFFMQLSKYCGWPLYVYLNERSKEEGVTFRESELMELEYFDFLAMTASEYVGENLLPFFDKWKCPVSTPAKQYMALFPRVSDEFWLTFDSAVLPSFTPRVPDLSHADQRPGFGLVKTLTSPDDKEFWMLSGELLDIDTEELLNSNDSDKNTNWRKIFDNDPSTSAAPLGDVHTPDAKNSHKQHHPRFVMDFMRPKMVVEEREVIGDDESVEIVSDTSYVEGHPHTFNALMVCNTRVDFMVNYIFDMQYQDESGEWKATKPSEFWLYHKNEFYYYPFDREYTAKKFRYELQSICPSTGDVARVVLNDIDWIMIEEDRQQ